MNTHCTLRILFGLLAGTVAPVVAGQAEKALADQSTTVSEPSDRPETGRIGIYGENRHYFACDDKPVLLVGATHLNGWTAVCTRSHDYRRDLQRLADMIRRANNPHVRGLARIVAYFPDAEGPQPWSKLEDGRYDLRRFDLAWERRLDDYLRLAAELGIVVSLEVWDDYSITRGAGSSAPAGGGNKAWGNHPFNPDNNINYGPEVIPATTQVEDAPFYRSVPARDNNRVLLELQQAYVDRLVDLCATYPNVLLNISNETRAKVAWSHYWAEYIRRRVGEDRLIGEMPSTQWRGLAGEQDPQLSCVRIADDSAYDYVDVSQFVCKYVPAEGVSAEEHAAGGAAAMAKLHEHMEESGSVKPLLVSKHYRNSLASGTPVLWAMFTGGAAGVRFHRPYSQETAAATEDFHFEQILSLARFLNGVEFWKMTPAFEIVSVPRGSFALVLAEPGRDYIVQILSAKGGQLQLQLPAGNYAARWYDAACGEHMADRGEFVLDEPGTAAIGIPSGKRDLVLRLTLTRGRT